MKARHVIAGRTVFTKVAWDSLSPLPSCSDLISPRCLCSRTKDGPTILRLYAKNLRFITIGIGERLPVPPCYTTAGWRIHRDLYDVCDQRGRGDMIQVILDVAEKLFGLREQLEKARRERRDRIADYLSELSKTLSDVAESLRHNEVPHGKCQEMRVYAQKLPETTGDEIGAMQAQVYAKQLADAHEVEMLLAEVHGSRK